MFDTPDHKGLRATLDCIPVAMFAAERPTPGDAFRILCVNRQYEDQTRLANVDVAGLRPLDYLTPKQAEAAESRYGFCCRHQRVVSYTEVLTLRGEETSWHTVLYPVNLAKEGQRIIGTAFALSPDGRFPAAMPFIDTAMEKLRRAEPLPIPFVIAPSRPDVETPDLKPAANIVPLDQRRKSRSQAFREPAVEFIPLGAI